MKGPRSAVQRTCADCTAHYTAAPSARTPYCPDCRGKRRRTKRHHKCNHCGAAFTSEKQRQDYCSKQCAAAAWWTSDEQQARREEKAAARLIKVHTWHPCAYCRTGIHNSRAVCCSPRCYVRHRDGLPRVQTCANAACARDFDVLTRGSAGLYCSQRCCSQRNGRIAKRRRRKALQDGRSVEIIDIAEIAKRDGWRCHICHRKVSADNWSIDHLVPISHGGPHTRDNVALAHHRCNTLRSDRGMAQLLLVG